MSKTRILKIIDGFITNSSTYNGTLFLAARRGKDLKQLLPKLRISSIFSSRFEEADLDLINDYDIEIDDLTDEYDILQVSVLLEAYGDDLGKGAPRDGEKNDLREFIEGCEILTEREYLLDDDIILLYFD